MSADDMAAKRKPRGAVGPDWNNPTKPDSKDSTKPNSYVYASVQRYVATLSCTRYAMHLLTKCYPKCSTYDLLHVPVSLTQNNAKSLFDTRMCVAKQSDVSETRVNMLRRSHAHAYHQLLLCASFITCMFWDDNAPIAAGDGIADPPTLGHLRRE